MQLTFYRESQTKISTICLILLHVLYKEWLYCTSSANAFSMFYLTDQNKKGLRVNTWFSTGQTITKAEQSNYEHDLNEMISLRFNLKFKLLTLVLEKNQRMLFFLLALSLFYISATFHILLILPLCNSNHQFRSDWYLYADPHVPNQEQSHQHKRLTTTTTQESTW